ncbi:hypothetical protein CPC08DRAFT_712560 [Agrocybe pediades]|nr:hypothetical protein CPC08DRAFT_712560 [Agrocybe pediades]
MVSSGSRSNKNVGTNRPLQGNDQSFLEKFEKQIQSLPSSIRDGTETDALAFFSGNPAASDVEGLDGDELWETVLNQTVKSGLGWGEKFDMHDLISRGKFGLYGLFNRVKHIIMQ